MRRGMRIALILVAVISFGIALSYPILYEWSAKKNNDTMEDLSRLRGDMLDEMKTGASSRQGEDEDENNGGGLAENDADRPESWENGNSGGDAKSTEDSEDPDVDTDELNPDTEAEQSYHVLSSEVSKEEVPEEASAEEPVKEEKAPEEASAEEPVKEEVLEETSIEEPVKEEVLEETSAEEPSVHEPVKEEAVSEETSAEEPSVQEPVKEEEVSEETSAEETSAEETSAEEPVKEEEAPEKTSAEEPEKVEAAPEEGPVSGETYVLDYAPKMIWQPVEIPEYGEYDAPQYADDGKTSKRSDTREGPLPYPLKEKVKLDKNNILPELEPIYEMNKDMVGWIIIEGTPVDYPVVQRRLDNEYYLHHDFFGNDNENGQIILDAKCDPYTPSYNLVVSGHHMRNGSMFGSLDVFKQQSFWEEHKFVTFDTLMRHGTYVIFAAFYSADYDEYEDGFRYNADLRYKRDVEMWLEEVAENNIYDTDITAEFGDEFLTITTCDHSRRDDGRFVLISRRLHEGEVF